MPDRNTATTRIATPAEIVSAAARVSHDGDLRYGVELEWDAGSAAGGNAGRIAVACAVAAYLQGKGYAVVYDGACPTNSQHRYIPPTAPGIRLSDGRAFVCIPDGSARGEIVSPVLTADDMPLLQDVVRGMFKAGCRKGGDAGIHVHVSAAPFLADGKALARLVTLFSRYDRFRETLTGRAHTNRWARSLSPRTFALADDAKRAGGSVSSSLRRRAENGDRYEGLNLTRLDEGNAATVEFRTWNATFHAGEVRAAVMLALGMCNRALKASKIKAGPREFSADWNARAVYTFLVDLGFNGKDDPAMTAVRNSLMARAVGMSGHETPEACHRWILRNGKRLATRQADRAAWPASYAPTVASQTRALVAALLDEYRAGDEGGRIVLGSENSDVRGLLRDAGIVISALPYGFVFSTEAAWKRERDRRRAAARAAA